MPKRRRRGFNPEELIDDVVDTAVDSFWDRAGDFFERLRESQRQQIEEGADVHSEVFTCAPCRKEFEFKDMEMVNPRNGFGICKSCFKFLWDAGKEKLQRLAQRAARQKAQQSKRESYVGHGPPPGAGAQGDAGHRGPQQQSTRQKPWEVLGVAPDASIDDIKRAYRKLAMEYHPDRVPPGASAKEREHARFKFEELTRAKEVMVKVRSAPEA